MIDDGAWISMLVLFATIVYCTARAIVDLRQKRMIWGIVGLASALALMSLPIKTHAVKINLPAASSR